MKTIISNQKFSEYVANPAKIDSVDSADIELLLEKFPYCQLLHAFYSKSLQNLPDFENQLAQAALYAPNRKVLHSILTHPESLEIADYTAYFNRPKQEAIETVIPDLEAVEANLVAMITAETEEQPGDQVQASLIEIIETIIPDLEAEETSLLTPENAEELTEEVVQAAIIETFVPDFEVQEANLGAPENAEVIIEEVVQTTIIETVVPDFEAREANLATPENEEIIEEVIQTTFIETIVPDFEAQEANLTLGKEEEIILDHIASADFFTFEEKLSPRQNNQEEAEALARPSQVSKYNDNQMPYTFLWWLHKTRQQYASTYQPYVNIELNASRMLHKQAGELNQQIIENIFHSQSPLDQLESQASLAEIKRREDEIIEKFIREEPQIKPPSSDKLDMENKARKSSEEPADLVSETLAMIYTEQMLYHKAIETYKKLSLKFPEKRTYFAHQIRELEKKIN